MSTKFEFTTDFQYDILKFTVQDSKGYKALELYDDSYFTLTSHSFIAYTLTKYYKKNHVIPGSVVFMQEINNNFNHRDFINNLTDEDRKEILKLSNDLFKGKVRDGEELLGQTEKFAQFVDLKTEIESIDLLDYEGYESFSRKVQKAISPRIKLIDDRGSFLTRDVRLRQIQRRDKSVIVPLPFSNLNRLTNAGGYIRNSILVILDAAKKWKTGMLVGIALNYLKTQNVLVIDLDNGKGEFMMRLEQSSSNLTKKQLLSGDDKIDKKVRKQIQKYKRVLKTELFIEEMPALITTADDIGRVIERLYREYGIEVGVLVIDYISKMGCISGKESLHERIGEAYIDISNLAKKWDIAHVWTAQHVNKDGQKNHMATRYESTDVAGTMDISRHAQAIFGLNRTEAEEEDGYQRMEVVEQRDGKKGFALFEVNRETQRVKEVEYDESVYKEYKEKYLGKENGDKPKRKAKGFNDGKDDIRKENAKNLNKNRDIDAE